jgi:hypothetical protein
VSDKEDVPAPQIPPGSIAAQAASPAGPRLQSVEHLPPKQKPVSHSSVFVQGSPILRVAMTGLAMH